uniref:C2HC/C3H-type domain-containing protein n=1 Tax=Rhipicephalus appendiculatus TaxID=34631 RepID=A0A131YZE7_RHIAP
MSASRLEQMRSQFQQNLQQRSGLPRPTRIPGPTTAAASKASPPVKQAAPSQSRTNGHSVVDGETISRANGKLQNGNVHKDVSVVRNGQLNGTSRPATNGTSRPQMNGTYRPQTNGTSGGKTVVANGTRPLTNSMQPTLPPVAKGGVLMTMTTTQLRQLCNGNQNGCGSQKPAAKPASMPPSRTASSVARTPQTVPLSRAPSAKPAAARAVSVELPKKPTTAPTSRQARTTNGTTPVAMQPRTSTAAPKAAPPPPEARPLGPNQERCDICGRGFNKDRIEKHRTICQKAATKKVKVFDATKMRTKGTEAESFVKKGLHKKEVPVKKPNWRAKHEEFLNAVRQARMVQEHLAAGGKLSDLPPPPPSENPDYVQCPKCLRKFNETAAERHIPRCNLAPKTSSSTPTRRPAALYGRK